MSTTHVQTRSDIGRTPSAGHYGFLGRVYDLKTITTETGTDLTESKIRQVILHLFFSAPSFFTVKLLVARGTYSTGASVADGYSIEYGANDAFTSKAGMRVLMTRHARMVASGLFAVEVTLDVTALAIKAKAEQHSDIAKTTTTLGLSIAAYTQNYTAAEAITGRCIGDIWYDTLATTAIKV
jgi:hypothetical protein